MGWLTKLGYQLSVLFAGEAHRKPFDKTLRAIHPLYLLHFDIFGLMTMKANRGASNFLLLLMTLHAIVMSIYLTFSKHYIAFTSFFVGVEKRKIKFLRTNYGCDTYLSDQFVMKGMIRQLTIPCTPQ